MYTLTHERLDELKRKVEYHFDKSLGCLNDAELGIMRSILQTAVNNTWNDRRKVAMREHIEYIDHILAERKAKRGTYSLSNAPPGFKP